MLSDGFRYPLPLGSAFGSEKSSGRKQQLMQTKRPEALRFRVFLARREGFEPPAFWSVGCLKGKSESFRLRFVLFTTVRSADFPLFPSSPARSNPILGQNWVRGCNIRRDWRTATLRHSPHYLSSYHKWSKDQRFMGVFVHHGSRFGLGDGVKVTTVDILIRCDGVAPW